MLFLLESSQWTEVTGDPLCLLSKIMVQHSTLNLMQYQPGWIRCIRCGWCNSGAVLTQGDAMQCMQWWCHYLDWTESPHFLIIVSTHSPQWRNDGWWQWRLLSTPGHGWRQQNWSPTVVTRPQSIPAGAVISDKVTRDLQWEL